jgi:hypothetical protein
MEDDFKLPGKEELAGLTDGQLLDGVAKAFEAMQLGWQGYLRQVMLGGAYLWEQRRRQPHGAWKSWCRTTYPHLAYTTLNNYINLYDWFGDKPEKDWPKNGVEEGLGFIRRAKEEVFRRDHPAEAKEKDEEREKRKAKQDKAKKDDAQRGDRLSGWEDQLNRAGLVSKDGKLRLTDETTAFLHALAEGDETEEEATERPEEADRRTAELAKMERVIATWFATKELALDCRKVRPGEEVKAFTAPAGKAILILPVLPADATVQES